MDGHQFRGARIHRDMMLVSSVCRRALGCEWGGDKQRIYKISRGKRTYGARATAPHRPRAARERSAPHCPQITPRELSARHEVWKIFCVAFLGTLAAAASSSSCSAPLSSHPSAPRFSSA